MGMFISKAFRAKCLNAEETGCTGSISFLVGTNYIHFYIIRNKRIMALQRLRLGYFKLQSHKITPSSRKDVVLGVIAQ